MDGPHIRPGRRILPRLLFTSRLIRVVSGTLSQLELWTKKKPSRVRIPYGRGVEGLVIGNIAQIVFGSKGLSYLLIDPLK